MSDMKERCGERIESLDQLHQAILNRQSVICPTLYVWAKPRPASFVFHLAGWTLWRMISNGMYLYIKKPTKKNKYMDTKQEEGKK